MHFDNNCIICLKTCYIFYLRNTFIFHEHNNIFCRIASTFIILLFGIKCSVWTSMYLNYTKSYIERTLPSIQLFIISTFHHFQLLQHDTCIGFSFSLSKEAIFVFQGIQKGNTLYVRVYVLWIIDINTFNKSIYIMR